MLSRLLTRMQVVINSVCNDCETKHEEEMRLRRKHNQMILLWALYVAAFGVHGNFSQLCKQKPTPKSFCPRFLLATGPQTLGFGPQLMIEVWKSVWIIGVKKLLAAKLQSCGTKAKMYRLKLLSATECCYLQRMSLRRCSFIPLCACACVVHLCNQKQSIHVFCGLTEVKLFIVTSPEIEL